MPPLRASVWIARVAAIQSTLNGVVMHQGQSLQALKGDRLEDGAPLTFYPGEVLARLPGPAFWQRQRFQFEAFRPQARETDAPLPHIRIDAVIEFLLGDKLR